MYGMMGNGIGANRADTTANGMSTTVTYGETVSGIEANRADTTANGTSATVTYGETVSGIGAKDITITTVTGKTVTTTVTTKTAINGRPNRARINVSQFSSTLASLEKSIANRDLRYGCRRGPRFAERLQGTVVFQKVRDAGQGCQLFHWRPRVATAALSTSESNAEATHKGISAANATAVLRA
jgi:hypothetical protein